MSVAVQTRHVSKDFIVGERPVRVLHDVSVEIRDRELTMIVGPSGCGKTTLISIMTGILSPTEGDVEIFGQALSQLSDEEKVLMRRHDIGFIFQQYNLLPALSVAENACLALLAAGVPYEVALERARVVMARLGMAAQVDKLPRQLSGGEQQRVAIARALVHNPRLIVCDEPTAALDGQTGAAVLEILREIADTEGRAVVVVSHDERIYKFADRILRMEDGRIVEDILPSEKINRDEL